MESAKNQQNPAFNQDVVLEEYSLMMEGFIYRTLDDVSNNYPVFTKNGRAKDVPILPVGMREIWAREDDLI